MLHHGGLLVPKLSDLRFQVEPFHVHCGTFYGLWHKLSKDHLTSCKLIVGLQEILILV